MVNKSIIDPSLQMPIVGIRSISDRDAQIIDKLAKVLNRMGNLTLQAVVESWKSIPDDDVIYALDQILDQTATPDAGQDEEGVKRKDYWIEIGGVRMRLRFINTYEPVDHYDYGLDDYVPSILINRQVDGMPSIAYGNTYISFTTSQDRDAAMVTLKHALITNGAQFIV